MFYLFSNLGNYGNSVGWLWLAPMQYDIQFIWTMVVTSVRTRFLLKWEKGQKNAPSICCNKFNFFYICISRIGLLEVHLNVSPDVEIGICVARMSDQLEFDHVAFAWGHLSPCSPNYTVKTSQRTSWLVHDDDGMLSIKSFQDDWIKNRDLFYIVKVKTIKWSGGRIRRMFRQTLLPGKEKCLKFEPSNISNKLPNW